MNFQNAADLGEKRRELEEFLKSLNQPILPYVIWLGALESLQGYIIINGFQYSYETIKAVEVCLQCLMAFHTLPVLCDYLWIFIQKYVYGIPCAKTYSVVTKFVTDLRTQSSTPKKSKTLNSVAA